MVHEQCMRPVNGKSRKMDSKKNKEEFVELLRSTGRDGVEDVISVLGELGFFIAPVSAGHHLNTAGGLVLLSINRR